MLNPLNLPPERLELLKSPPLEIDDAAIEQAVKAALREAVVAPARRPRKKLPEIAPAECATAEREAPVTKRMWPSYQPRWSHSAAIFALALVIAYPWVLPVTMGLLVALVTLAYLMLGQERSVAIGASCFVGLQRWRPAQAEALRAWAIRRVDRLERLLGRLPERWTAGIYLPDFGPTPDCPDKMQRDPFARLRSEQAQA
ncbi:hypothetical protein SAMN04488239_102360 [Ruegeria marina]|uniref:Uncharacterized protein n=2 Tax=Ruegeria marina TaxID=639004 RepID=A0A1G6LYP9_9RHOB|nr:hypothetical protein SAMN04488239_102360 [Ruegeria marina]